MAVTFDRAVALAHPDRALLTWDHPMVRDCVDTLFEVGNAGVAQCTGPQPGLMLEALYVAEPTVAQGLRADQFFPPTPIRVLVDMDGAEVEIDAGALRALAALVAAGDPNDGGDGGGDGGDGSGDNSDWFVTIDGDDDNHNDDALRGERGSPEGMRLALAEWILPVAVPRNT